jgi:hypothetical protein
MPVLCLRTGQSAKKCYLMYVCTISHGRRIFAHIQVGGGGLVAVGGGGKAAKQGKGPFTAKIRPFIRRLSASQTSELFCLN